MFEKLTAPSLGMSGASMIHIRGAMSIIESRGKLNFASALSTQIARNILSHFIISCGMTKSFISDSQVAVWKDLSGLVMDSKLDYMGILVDIVNLRAILSKGIMVHDSEINSKVFGIKCKLEYLADSLERSCGPFTVFLSHWQALGGEYDVYLNHFTMQLHNAVRMMRLEMEGLVRARCYEQNVDAINMIAKQICRSVTHYIMPQARPENSEPFTPMQKLECRILMAPLYQAAQLSTDSCVQEWIGRILDYMAEKGNMRIARDVLDLTKKSLDNDYWTIWAMAGCYATAA
ncbi:C6 transcription factor [Fusarium acutatum]|uniref:C6 transcription factor n=1 Tax=Fusarium acutatum TaxID=78861 RepID=A0A8H4NMU7_9HYPO|nr:C6 transcription factor [Fusarium acutatum]